MSLSEKQIHEKVAQQEINIDEALKLIRSLKQPTAAVFNPLTRTFTFEEVYVRDHTVLGERLLLGVTYFSLAAAAGRQHFPDRHLRGMRRLLVQHPLILQTGQQVEVTTDVSEAQGRYHFRITGRKTGDAAVIEAASGELLFEAIESPQPLDLLQLQRAADRRYSGETIYADLRARQIVHGPTLRTVRKVWADGTQSLGELVLGHAPDTLDPVDPALLEGAIISSAKIMEAQGDRQEPFILITTQKVGLFGPLPSRCFAWSRLVRQSEELMVANIWLCDPQGQVLVTLDEVCLKRVSQRAAINLNSAAEPMPSLPATSDSTAEDSGSPDELTAFVEAYLGAKLGPLVPSSNGQIDRQLNFLDLGVDSNQLVALARELEGEIGIELYPTLFFEHSNLAQLSDYLISQHPDQTARFFGPQIDARLSTPPRENHKAVEARLPVPASQADSKVGSLTVTAETQDDIAIIGMAGRFADAPNLARFWQNIINGKDLIREIPKDHFDYRPWYDPHIEALDRLYCKWGSFIDGVAYFDADFFRISPREAAVMDPQLRLLLQELYAAAEDAGYAHRLRGSDTGMYVGACSFDYCTEMVARHKPVGPYDGSGNAATMLANRPSFFFDLKGPSLLVDTACSSSLVALHLACQALNRGECTMAFAAGVNLLLASWHYRYFCSIGALSATGRCHTFDARADGYVPGEAVAAVLLKPLSRALADGDRIYAVIKGTAVNHGGYTPSITAPSTQLEARVIVKAWETAGVAPSTIGYIEAHGTGTRLGDPVEIDALKQVFVPYSGSEPFCAVGSAKAHIGHAEGAAGIAGVVKTVLSLQHKQIPAMPMLEQINPLIKLEGSPLYINRSSVDWPAIGDAPRRAGVNAFGFGGTYAHAVLEEYVAPAAAPLPSEVRLFVLSARNQDRLRARAAELAAYLENRPVAANDLADMAYTLQTGREAMDVRLAALADDSGKLADVLRRFARGDTELPGFFIHVKHGSTPGSGQVPGKPDAVQSCIEAQDWQGLAEHWISGAEIDWTLLYESIRPKCISLPTYPFKAERHWINLANADSPATESTSAAKDIHALKLSNTSTFAVQQFSLQLDGRAFYLDDHVLGEQRTLPGVVYLEMVRAAGELSAGRPVQSLQAVVWSQPIIVTDTHCQVLIRLHPEEGGRVGWEVIGQDAQGAEIRHSQGKLVLADQEHPVTDSSVLDIEAIRQRCPRQMSAEAFYEGMASSGVHLGASFKMLEQAWYGDGEALAHFRLPADRPVAFGAFGLDPSVLDIAMQIPMLLFENSAQSKTIGIPFTVERVDLHHPLTRSGYVHAVFSDSDAAPSKGIPRITMRLSDDAGWGLVTLRDFVGRTSKQLQAAKAPTSTNAIVRRWYQHRWMVLPATRVEVPKPAGPWMLFAPNTEMQNTLRALLGSPDAEIPALVVVTPGAGFAEISERHFAIDPNRQGDYRKLFKTLEAQDVRPRQILHCWCLDRVKDDRHRLKEKLSLGIHSLFYLVQALVVPKPAEAIRLLYVYPNSDDCPQPWYAAANAFAPTVRMEQPHVLCSALALADISDETSAHNDRIIAEGLKAVFAMPTADHAELRYAGGRLYISRLSECVPSPAPADSLLKSGGVYLISGGLGGLGRLFGDYLARRCGARLVLAGRSMANENLAASIRKLEAAGAEVLYLQTDVSRPEDVERLVAEAKKRFARIDGVIHAAGVVRDAYITAKTPADMEAVLAPKIHGAIRLDEALASEPLDFFVMFSSVTSVFGNIGQSDYGCANRFLDAWAAAREGLRIQGRRQGKTLSINWPLWREGGMQMDAASEKLFSETLGLSLLDTTSGLEIFSQAMNFKGSHCLVMEGDGQKIEQLVAPQRADTQQSTIPDSVQRDAGGAEALRQFIETRLANMAAQILEIAPEKVARRRDMSEYGFESISLTEFANRINTDLGLAITPAVFFEYTSLETLARYLCSSHGDRIAMPAADGPPRLEPYGIADLPAKPIKSHRFAPPPARQKQTSSKPCAADEPVAFVGMSGVMPGSEDLAAFWGHLINGEHLIGEVPAERWDWRTLCETDSGSETLPALRWGAFMKAVDQFDAPFFNVSPREAALMDPQQRLMLETVWKTVEDAGYSAEALRGSRTGVFIGVSGIDYVHLVKAAGIPMEPHVTTGMAHSVLANRISYFFDWHGPSQPVDTACSSSLVAVHRAVEAIRKQWCEQALVGGVNVMLDVDISIGFARAGMLSPDGRCKTFDKCADGYVRGEGCGALLLKPLSKARTDGDHIYALIRGTAENHGGHASTLTAPNPAAQADLLVDAYERSGIDPASIGYIEAHGTGTRLGDPVEIEGLKKAFARLYRKHSEHMPAQPRTGIGAVKTNIGHLEAAAGMAGLFKVLLALQHKRLPASLNFSEINPHIKLENSPFYLVTQTQDWTPLQDAHGQPLPRRAGVSCFGFGGANAHIILEEYGVDTPSEDRTGAAPSPRLIVLSARSEERLRAYAAQLAAFLKAKGAGADHDTLSLASVAHTLQTGRVAMAERLALIVSELDELVNKLERFAGGQSAIEGLYCGHGHCEPEHDDLLLEGEAGRAFLDVIIKNKDLPRLARLWVKGANLDWRLLYSQPRPERVPLPTYPFERQRYWFDIHPPAGRLQNDVAPTGKSAEPPPTSPPLPTRSANPESTAEIRKVIRPRVKLKTPAQAAGPPQPQTATGMQTAPALRSDPSDVVGRIRKDLRAMLAAVLYVDAESIDESAPLVELGLDSVMGVALIRRINQAFDLQMKVTELYDHPTVKALAAHLAQQMSGPPGPSAAPLSASPPLATCPADADIPAETREVVQPRIKLKGPVQAAGQPQPQTATGSQTAAPLRSAQPDSAGGIWQDLRAMLAAVLYVDAESIDESAPLVELGLDSVMGVALIRRINQAFDLQMKVTELYDHPTVKALAAYLAEQVPASLHRSQPEASWPVSQAADAHRQDAGAVAVIGMAGRFPGADDLDAFWQNLREGVDSITEVPRERWDVQAFYDPKPGKANRTYCKWGGFLSDHDKFDALFFKISPVDAQAMAPQQRLVLQESYRALEDAGYAGSALSGLKCGVYIGAVNNNEYGELLSRSQSAGGQGQVMLGNANSVMAARISYFLNLKGPALTLDTACSSSLVAIHLACKGLQTGEAEMMLAGGVLVGASERRFTSVSMTGALSASGRCRPFDNNADGYVPGEAVGIVVLKLLSKALTDGDHIYGLITGSGVNQDGATNGITAPSAESQKKLALEVYRRHKIDPQTITYVEAHGTGTKLGDPIEIAALTDAFRVFTDKKKFCALGAVKSNIGHGSAAAGITGLIKVLLALANRQLPPSLHFKQPNEHIDFDNSPFYVNSALQDWPSVAGQPRRAAISSFGLSGTNAHLVIEEAPPRTKQTHAPRPYYLIPLSAKTPEALQRRISELAAWLACTRFNDPLDDLACTLAMGRDHFVRRAAFVVQNTADLQRKLLMVRDQGYCTEYWQTGPHPQAGDAETGPEKQGNAHAAALPLGNPSDAQACRADLADLAARYVRGFDPDWSALYPVAGWRRIPLPAYPFERERYWIDTVPAAGDVKAGGNLHPFLDRNVSTLTGMRFSKHLKGDEFYLTDHVIGGKKLFPAVACIEMACMAGQLAAEKPVRKLKNLIWAQPIAVHDAPTDVQIRLNPNRSGLEFEVGVADGNGRQGFVHSQGRLLFDDAPAEPVAPLDLAAIKARASRRLKASECYRRYTDRGVRYGPSFQSIRALYANSRESLAELVLHPDHRQGFHQYRLHPTFLDGALQSIIGLEDEAQDDGHTLFMPFVLGEVEIFGSLSETCFAYATPKPAPHAGNDQVMRFQILLADPNGAVRVRLDDFSIRTAQHMQPAPGSAVPRRQPDIDPTFSDEQLKTLLARLANNDLTAAEAQRMTEGIL